MTCQACDELDTRILSQGLDVGEELPTVWIDTGTQRVGIQVLACEHHAAMLQKLVDLGLRVTEGRRP